jgi:hypothetical protein
MWVSFYQGLFMSEASQVQIQDARTEYTRRWEARRACSARYQRQHMRLGNARLAIAVAAAAMAWFAFWHGALSPWWLLLPGIIFVVLVLVHARVIRRRDCASRAAALYEKGLARLADRWAGAGVSGERFLDRAHPYAEDLDLFGRGSLFELLCTTRTRTGEETLARWLLGPASPEEVRARQAAVAELRPRLDLREELALVGEDLRSGISPQALAAWSEDLPSLASRHARITAAVLSSLALVSAALWAVLHRPAPFLAVVLVIMVFSLRLRPRVQRIIQRIGEPAYGLELLSLVLVRFERERFTSSKLLELQAALNTAGSPPSRRIAHLHRLMELLDSRDNLLVRIIGPPLLWTTQVALAIEAWREANGPSVRGWLAAAGELEALSALANYAYEHPSDPFPELIQDGACFEGEALGHPLLPQSRCVSNDVRLGADLCVLVVSGSNMSGKSTLLRTVGINTVLAMAGAPVRARQLRLSPLTVGAAIRILDSLQDGSSRFYAEITRLRRLLDLTGKSPPLLFLLDELLHDTNSHDRRIGAEAFVRDLVKRGAIGLLTTHDLALGHIAEVLAPRGANVHFEDHIESGKLTFDYRLRPGIVRKSNALELMRSVGLEV